MRYVWEPGGEVRAAAAAALLKWHPEFSTMEPDAWEALVKRTCAAWVQRAGAGSPQALNEHPFTPGGAFELWVKGRMA